jgi:carboxypeptidase family protein
MRHLAKLFPAAVIACLLGAALAWASITGSISGVVTDQNGGVVVGAKVAAIETQTGVRSEIRTDSQGFYNFPAIPVGKYDLEVQSPGFKLYRQSGLVVDVNSALRVNVTLQLGEATEKVTITSDAVQVETQNTQMGEVISGAKIVAVPLNGRAFTDLLSLQPGVVPTAYREQAPDINSRGPSGGLDAGNLSVNGQRETANGFMVNGVTVVEGRNNGAGIIPNLDSIEEFRIITNNFDAEYGNYSGGQVNVATKSGTNQFHGSAFEFLRNTALDARNFFDTTGQVPEFKQNQFGATGGGPIKHDKLFFYGDYQGTRQIQAPTQNFPVPSMADRTGDLSDVAGDLTGAVNGTVWAQTLQKRLAATTGQIVTSGEPYFFPGCDITNCVFPGAVIPSAAFSPVTSHLLPFIPTPTPGAGGNFDTSAFSKRLRDDKGAIRIDGNTRIGMLSAYYFLDDYTLNDPYPNGTAAPGFNALTNGRGQLISLGDTKIFTSSAVNELRLGFFRFANLFSKPQGGVGTSLASLGFVVPPASGPFNGGIGPIDPTVQGVPSVHFNNFAFGVPDITPAQYNNTYQVIDTFSKIIGTHTLKFGGQIHYDQINGRNLFGENGFYSFDGEETGLDFADFLIGAVPSFSFIQASKQVIDSRSKYMGLFFQDSWRVKSSLTLNYGLRWEFSQPWYDTQNKTETIIPGKQSVLFPTAPTGWLVAGDPGVPPTLAPTRYNNFAPRIGLAYSPNFSGSFLGKLTGGPGKTSIRMSYGIYYTAYEDLSQFLEIGDQPYGVFFVAPTPVLFEQPYTDRTTGFTRPAIFPFTIPTGVSAKNPDTNFPWPVVEPISSGFVFSPTNKLPYAEHYDLSLQRQLGGKTVLSLSYVGNQAHKLITSVEANPGIANLCNEINTLGATDTFGNSCGPGGENPSPPGYVLPFGTKFPADAPATVQSTAPCISNPAQICNVITTTRTALGPAFASNPYMMAAASSAYSSLQVSLRHTSEHASFLLGYTYAKSLDNASGLEDSTNVFNFKASRSLSLFDVKHNFVASYDVKVPFDKLFHSQSGLGGRLLKGWSVTGITTFATGLPVTLSEGDDAALIGATIPFDAPQIVGTGKVLNDTNPRHQSFDQNGNLVNPYFNTALFSTSNVGQIGNANRRFFHGPGLNNWDMGLLKDTKISESKSLEFRFEAFNIFNHAQFSNPDGNINGSFGAIFSTSHDPRIMQAALKFSF